MSDKLFSRRELLRTFAIVGAAAMLPIGLAGCSKKELSCTPSSLSTEDETMRANVQYVEASTDPEKHCSNCLLFKPAAENPEGSCGGCNLLKGDINPKGFCKSWAKKG